MQDLIRQLIAALGEDPGREGLVRTPQRVEKALKFLTSGYAADIDIVLNDAGCVEYVVISHDDRYVIAPWTVAEVDYDERIITIEDAVELQLQQEHVVRLESRPANIKGKGEITIRDLVKNSLRMRPDRIVVGECRGGEALDMLQAMNTGHDGSLTTIHSNSPRDTLSRIETMVAMELALPASER